MSERYQRGAFRVIGLDAARVVLIAPGSEQGIVAPRRVGEALAACTGFGTLADHARRICAQLRLPSEQEAEVIAVLSEATQKGLLISVGDVLESVARGRPSERVRIDALGVVTRDRPQALERCLRSFGAHLLSFGREVRMVIVDSTPSLDAEGSRAGLEAAVGARVQWIGLREKAALAEVLARTAGVDPAIVRFGLFGVEGLAPDVGANRNALLLALAGEPFLSTDDDMVCDLRVSPGAGDRLAIGGEELPVGVTLYRDFASAREALLPASVCVLDGHEQLLGRRLAARIRETDPDRIALDVPPGLLRSLLADEATVAATFGGYYGDAGAGHPAFYLWSAPGLREQLLTGPAHYRALLASRQIVRIAPVATVGNSRFSMCGGVGLDARGLLPPFFPVLRGEDLSFGALFRSCSPEGLFAHLPQALAHLPWEAREASPERLWDPTPSVSTLIVVAQVLELAEAAVRLGPAGERRLRHTGRFIRELAALPPPELQQLLRERVTVAAGRTATRRQSLLQQAHGEPHYWAADLRAAIEHQGEVACHPDRAIPTDLRTGRSREEVAALLCHLLDRYGQLLEAWPDLLAAASRLRFGAR